MADEGIILRRPGPRAESWETFKWFLFGSWEFLFWIVATINLVETYSYALPPLEGALPPYSLDDDGYFDVTSNLLTRFLLIADYLLLCHCFSVFISLYLGHAAIRKWSRYGSADSLAMKFHNDMLLKRRYRRRSLVAGSKIVRLFLCQSVCLIIILLLNKETASVVSANIFPAAQNHNATVVHKNKTAAVVLAGEPPKSATTQFVSGAVTVLMVQLAFLAYRMLTELLLCVSSGMREQLLVKMKVDKEVAHALSTRMDCQETLVFRVIGRNDVAPKLLSMLVREGSKKPEDPAGVPQGCLLAPEAKIQKK